MIIIINNIFKVDRNDLRISISRSHSGTIKNILNRKLKNFELVEAAGAGKCYF